MKDRINSPTVVLTDHPWLDVGIERDIIEGAGFHLLVGPSEAPPVDAIDALIKTSDPVAILTCWAPVSAAAIMAARNLRIVARLGVGLDNIDVAQATTQGVWVTNVPDYCVAEVSDHAVGMALSFERGITALDRDVRARGWHVPQFTPRRLSTLVVGLVGYGRIGRATAAKFKALGCRVVAADPFAKHDPEGAELVTLETLQDISNIIILHAPLNAQTHHLVNQQFISRCAAKPLLINVSRGGLVDNAALAAGLDAGTLRGAALDVADGEPAPPAWLLKRADVISTPHIAYLSAESLVDLRRSACEDVVRVLQGKTPLQARNAPVQAPDAGPDPAGVSLTGGVSSDIRLVQTPEGPIVVKTALSRLKVPAQWLSNPQRSHTEVLAIKAAARLLGASVVPEILWAKPEENSFAMRPVDARLRNWKQNMMAGDVDIRTARQAGVLLGQLHRRSMRDVEMAEEFGDQTGFEELRITPFFKHTADKLPALKADILYIAHELSEVRTALVHGDYSPKNILADGDDLVLLDFEVAHWGNPAFDVAFCLSHLLLKSRRKSADANAFRAAVEGFLSGYAAAEGPAAEDQKLVRLTGCLILARIDGDSQVDYLADMDVAVTRKLGEEMVKRPAHTVSQYVVLRAETF